MGGERIRPQCRVQPTGTRLEVPVLGDSSEVVPVGATILATTFTTTAIATVPTINASAPIAITTTNVSEVAVVDAGPEGRLVPQKRERRTRSAAAAAAAAGRHCRTARAAAGGGASALTQIDDAGVLIGAPHQGSLVTQIGMEATAPAALQRPQLAAGGVLRCVSDLELAVSHLRRRDPKLVPLIDAHGLPYPLLASTATTAAATTAAATTAAATTTSTASKALSAAGSYEDPSLGCGKGTGRVRHSSVGGCGSTDIITPLHAANVPSGGSAATAAVSGGSSGGGPWDGTSGGGGSGGGRNGGSVFSALARSV
ncbi:hypothetical protein Vafri_21094, partial [Volvox africanus]